MSCPWSGRSPLGVSLAFVLLCMLVFAGATRAGAQCRVEGLSGPGLSFAVAPDGQVTPPDQSLWLHNDSAWQLEGLAITDVVGLLVAPADSFALAPGDSLEFVVSYDATGCGGAEVEGSLSFVTVCDSIAVQVIGDAYFRAQLSAVELDFEEVPLGASDQRSFVVSNEACGEATLRAEFVPGGASHPEFSLSMHTFDFGTEITVTYAPIDLGTDEVGLEIVVESSTTDGIWLTPTVLTLRGEGSYEGPSWYVATDGADSNAGTQQSPFLTLQRAVDAAANGDSVRIFDGTHAGPGNVNVQWQDRSLHFASVSGNRDACIVECGGAPGFVYADSVAGNVHQQSFVGLTVRNASTAISATGIPPWQGGIPVSVSMRNARLLDGAIGLQVDHGSIALRGIVVRGFSEEGVTSSWTDLLSVDTSVLRNNGVGLSFGQFVGGAHVEVDSTEIVANGIGLSYYQEAYDLFLSHCRVDSSSAGDGIQTASDDQWCSLANTSVVGNAGHGIAVPGSSLVSVVDSRIAGNGQHGIAGGIALTLDNAELSGNGGWGVGNSTVFDMSVLAEWIPEHATQQRQLDPSLAVDIVGCEVRGNLLGGLDLARPFTPLRIESTLVVDNVGGAGLRLANGTVGFEPALTGLTIAGNGGAGLEVDDIEVVATQLLIVGNQGPATELLLGAILELSCSNLFGNTGGDWTGNVSAQAEINGNFSADPYFVDAPNGDYSVLEISTCLPGNHPGAAECGAVGGASLGGFAAPQWISIEDVANDQGRRMRLTWSRSHFDAPGSAIPVTGYGIYRRQDAFKLTEGAVPSKLDGWDFLETVPSRGDDVYQYVAETLCDSTIMVGDCPTAFFISAMTNDPFVFYDSVVDSGSSVDNLSPESPTGFAVDYDYENGHALSWSPNVESDLRGYRVYRCCEGPGAPEYVFAEEIIQTAWTDTGTDPQLGYRITAVDFSGNESPVSEPQTVTAVAAGGADLPARTSLLGAYPNPFNPSTTVSFELARRSSVSVRIHDLAGRLVRSLDLGELAAGRAEVQWNGSDQSGHTVASGVYLVRLVTDRDAQTLRVVLVK